MKNSPISARPAERIGRPRDTPESDLQSKITSLTAGPSETIIRGFMKWIDDPGEARFRFGQKYAAQLLRALHEYTKAASLWKSRAETAEAALSQLKEEVAEICGPLNEAWSSFCQSDRNQADAYGRLVTRNWENWDRLSSLVERLTAKPEGSQ